jgi:hypothetical protein
MGLTTWEILKDILYYDDCIMIEILEIEFSSLYDGYKCYSIDKYN